MHQYKYVNKRITACNAVLALMKGNNQVDTAKKTVQNDYMDKSNETENKCL